MNKKGFNFKKTIGNLKTFFSTPSNTILVIFALLLTVMVIYPLITLVLDAFTVHTISEASDINDAMGTSLRKGDFQSLKDTLFRASWPKMLKRPSFNRNIIRKSETK